jgi:hypothetical protein
MKFHTLFILVTVGLLAVACSQPQESEQAALQENAATDEQEAKTQELRKIAQVKDPAVKIKQLESFIEENSGGPIVSRAQTTLLRTLAKEEPMRAIELADQMLQDSDAAQAPSSRRNAMMFKFIALRNLKDEAALEKMGAEILESETNAGLLQQAARFDETHSKELMEKALAERAKDESPTAYPTLADLHSSYARTLSLKKESSAAMEHMSKAIELSESQVRDFEISAEESDARRLQRARDGLNRMYQSMADICAEAGQPEKGLEYLGLAEKAMGENDREQIPRLASTRAKLYEGMSKFEKALESYVQSFAFRMSRESWQKIESLAKENGRSLEEIRAEARELRLAQATTFTPFELKTLEGESKNFKDVQSKVTLVNFFFPT